MDDEGSLLKWVLGSCVGIGAMLVGAVRYLYTSQIKTYEERLERSEKRVASVEKRADDCEQDRAAIRIQQAEQAVRLEALEARVKEA